MNHLLSRRRFLASSSILCAGPMLCSVTAGAQDAYTQEPPGPVHAQFPSQDPALVKEMVGASHGNLARVRELLERSPALAKATYDWGFGDWETALGAASHVGNRAIASLLMEHGARPDIFTSAMFGQLETVKAYITANPGIQRLHGPHGITLLQHARNGGEQSSDVAEYLETLGDADMKYTSLPLTDDEKQKYAGEYAFGGEPSHTLTISIDKNGRLNVKRGPEGTNRVLFHQGNHEFHPAGAPAVRIRFEMHGMQARSLTVIDGQPVLTAQRT